MRAFTAAILLGILACHSEPAAAILPIAVSNQPAPGAPSGLLWDDLRAPSINRRGEVAFTANFFEPGAGARNDGGLWIGRPGELSLAAAAGTPVDGFTQTLSSVSLDSFLPLSDSGEVVFRGASNSPGTTTSLSGLWVASPTGVRQVALTGQSAESLGSDATFDRPLPSTLRLNNAGDVLYSYTVNLSPGEDDGQLVDSLWVSHPDGALRLLAADEPAGGPAGDAAVPIYRRAGEQPFNDRGTAAFTTRAAGSDFLPFALAVDSAGGLAVPVVGQEPAPGFEGRTFDAAFPSSINNRDQVVFQSALRDPTDNSTLSSYWIAEGDRITPIVASGEPAPGFGEGFAFDSLPYEPVINHEGKIAFYGNAVNEDRTEHGTGIWIGDADGLELVVKQGDPAPGTDSNFRSLIRNSPVLNRRGQIAFLAGVESGSIFGGIWATDVDGNVVRIIGQGDQLEVAPGDLRTVSFVGFSNQAGGEDGAARGLNDAGQIVFQAVFEDGTSGVFLSERVASLEGDFNGDGVVDTADYEVWRAEFGGTNPLADGNRDGRVDAADYTVWRDQLGLRLFDDDNPPGASTPAPEPHAAALIAWIVAAACTGRRRGPIAGRW